MRIDVDRVAALANVPLTKKERQLFGMQLSSILSYFEKLSIVDTQSVAVSAPFISPKPLREDEPGTSMPFDALSNAVAVEKKYIRIKGIFKE